MIRRLLLLSVLLLWALPALAQSQIPENTYQVSNTGLAAAAVSCTAPAPTNGGWNHLTGFTVICGAASGATTENNVTITGLYGTGTPTYPLIQSTAGVSFASEDYTYPPTAATSASTIVVSYPAVVNGGKCSCALFYQQY